MFTTSVCIGSTSITITAAVSVVKHRGVYPPPKRGGLSAAKTTSRKSYDPTNDVQV